MKNWNILAPLFLTIFFGFQSAHAEDIFVTLNFTNYSLSSNGNDLAKLDLKAEISRQIPWADFKGLRLGGVEVTGSSAVADSSLTLSAGSNTLDTKKVQSTSVVLNARTTQTAGAWLLTVRGSFKFEEIRITLSEDATAKVEPADDWNTSGQLTSSAEPKNTVTVPPVEEKKPAPAPMVVPPPKAPAPAPPVVAKPVPSVINGLEFIEGEAIFFWDEDNFEFKRGTYLQINGDLSHHIAAEQGNLDLQAKSLVKRTGCVQSFCTGQDYKIGPGDAMRVIGFSPYPFNVIKVVSVSVEDIGSDSMLKRAIRMNVENFAQMRRQYLEALAKPAVPANPAPAAPAKKPTVVKPAPAAPAKKTTKPKTTGKTKTKKGNYDWTSDGRCAEFASNGVAIRIADFDACRQSSGSSYDWTSDGRCAEFASNGVAIRIADNNSCRKSSGSKYDWTVDGRCAEFASNGVAIRIADNNSCRKSSGSRYDWTVDGRCAEFASNGIAIRIADLNSCRKSSGSRYARTVDGRCAEFASNGIAIRIAENNRCRR